MFHLRKAEDRGHANHGWLKAAHTFSFSEYHDPQFMGFRDLRVINEDRIAAAEGFPTHGHQNMEIITYILGGSLAHKDSMGNGSVIKPGDIQYMSAGSGVRHSEFNASKTEEAHLLQIWILPQANGLKPAYGQKHFTEEERTNRLKQLASVDGADGSVQIRQDIRLFGSLLQKEASISYELNPSRHAWLQLAKGEIDVNGIKMQSGDGLAVSEERLLKITGIGETAEFLLFDLN